MGDLLPRVVPEGELRYEDIPTRVGIEPLLPVLMVWDRRCEVYLPAPMVWEEEQAFLVELAERMAEFHLPVHYWRVRCHPWQRWRL